MSDFQSDIKFLFEHELMCPIPKSGYQKWVEIDARCEQTTSTIVSSQAR